MKQPFHKLKLFSCFLVGIINFSFKHPGIHNKEHDSGYRTVKGLKTDSKFLKFLEAALKIVKFT